MSKTSSGWIVRVSRGVPEFHPLMDYEAALTLARMIVENDPKVIATIYEARERVRGTLVVAVTDLKAEAA